MKRNYSKTTPLIALASVGLMAGGFYILHNPAFSLKSVFGQHSHTEEPVQAERMPMRTSEINDPRPTEELSLTSEDMVQRAAAGCPPASSTTSSLDCFYGRLDEITKREWADRLPSPE